MNRIARWRLWLGSLIMGRRPASVSHRLTAKRTGPVRPFVRQPWMSPPDDEVGVGVPVAGIVTAGAEAVVALNYCVAYTTGFQLGVVLRKKHDPPPIADPRLHRDSPEFKLEIGVTFADGRATSKGSDPHRPAGPIIGSSGGGGGGRSWSWNYWIWPLPPDGPMAVTCHWPEGGVPDGEVEVDGSEIRRVGLTSAKLWPEGSSS